MRRPALLALLVLLAPSVPARAQGTFVLTIDGSQSNFTWTADTDIGPIEGDPNNDFQLQGTVDVAITSGALGIVSASFVGGDALVVPDIHGTIPNPLPFLPPLATVDITGLHLTSSSPAFAVAGNGAFTASVVLTATAGTMTIDAGILGSGSTPLAGSQSAPTAVNGSLVQSAGTITLTAPITSTFDFTDPDTGINGSVALSGTLVADHVCPVPTGFCTAVANSTGLPAAMGWSGSTSLAGNDLVLLATDVPANNNGLFIYSPMPTQVPLGNGNLCISNLPLGFVLRLPAETSGPGGTITHALDLTAPPDPLGQVTAGSTWYFSCWFRDPAAGGAFFNFADGLCVTFCP